MRKRGVLIINCILIVLLTGCWSRIEVNDLSIVMATAIDKMNNGKFRVSVQVAIPKQLGPVGAGGTGSGDGTTVLISETGESVMDAIQRLQVKLPRRIFFSHSRNLIIGERAARDGIFQTLDFISRVREARLRSFILFTKGEAAPLLKLTPSMERYTSETIREEQKMGAGVRIRIKDFIDMLTTEGISPLGAQVAIMPEEKGGENSKQTPAIVGTAVFNEDKLAGWMNDQDTLGVLWIRNEIEKANITVTVPKEKGGGKIGVQLMKGQSKVKPILEKRKVKMNVSINAEVELFENGSKLDLGNPKELHYVQTLLEKDVKEKCRLALDKGQNQLHSDIFGFGNALYRTYPKAWKEQYKKQWMEEFPELEVSIHPHVSIVRTGLTIKSPEMKD
ncbi:Ger(x)C family spore germination protein [Neobacillus sp. DY30]|uniref:Ger(x)C family spore germination protein n=1 Tax=Neobacillus sp. DY30 TaxID=3047871 RepID=UPI0024C05242|nr:Ger(x)C family spore germination protein [Neobacillus sp. DY30]WHY01509.1 Ger(x)C family spore germination protein [Neobacillus sp. DY30]